MAINKRIVTVNPSGGGDYTSLVTALSSEKAYLVINYAGQLKNTDYDLVFRCTGGADTSTGSVTVSAFNGDDDHTITVEGIDDLTGTFDNSKYYFISSNSSYSALLADNTTPVIIKNLQILNTANASILRIQNSKNLIVENCLLQQTATSVGYVIDIQSNTSYGIRNIKLINNILIGRRALQIGSQKNGDIFTVYNNTCRNLTPSSSFGGGLLFNGYSYSGTLNLINNCFWGFGEYSASYKDYIFSNINNYTINSYNNISGDATVSGIDCYSNQPSPDFVTASGGNITANDTVLNGRGKSLVDDLVYPITEDAFGNLRDPDSFSIGAHQAIEYNPYTYTSSTKFIFLFNSLGLISTVSSDGTEVYKLENCKGDSLDKIVRLSGKNKYIEYTTTVADNYSHVVIGRADLLDSSTLSGGGFKIQKSSNGISYTDVVTENTGFLVQDDRDYVTQVNLGGVKSVRLLPTASGNQHTSIGKFYVSKAFDFGTEPLAGSRNTWLALPKNNDELEPYPGARNKLYKCSHSMNLEFYSVTREKLLEFESLPIDQPFFIYDPENYILRNNKRLVYVILTNVTYTKRIDSNYDITLTLGKLKKYV